LKSAAFLDLFFNEMVNALAEGDRVEIRNDFMQIYLAWQRKR
jgi:nucleoid DNA-binding protein